MPEKPPRGWVKTKLGEVCLPVASVQPEDFPDTHFTYFDIGGIDNEKTVSLRRRSSLGGPRQVVLGNCCARMTFCFPRFGHT
jgi:hypothetical protein